VVGEELQGATQAQLLATAPGMRTRHTCQRGGGQYGLFVQKGATHSRLLELPYRLSNFCRKYSYGA
jgi:hypothetical protein